MQKLNAKLSSLALLALVSCFPIAQAGAKQHMNGYYHAPSGCYLDVQEDLLQYNRGYNCDDEFRARQQRRHEQERQEKQERQERKERQERPDTQVAPVEKSAQPVSKPSEPGLKSAEPALQPAEKIDEKVEDISPEERRRRAKENLDKLYDNTKEVLGKASDKAGEAWTKAKPYLEEVSSTAGGFFSDYVKPFFAQILEGCWAIIIILWAFVVLIVQILALIVWAILTVFWKALSQVVPALFNSAQSAGSSFFHFLLGAVFLFLLGYLGLRGWKLLYELQRLNRLVRSAEFGILEKYRRWSGSDGGDKKVSKNLQLFETLAAPVIEVNKGRLVETAFINMAPATAPVNIFKEEAAAVYSTRQEENSKASKRKRAARTSLTLYKYVLFGEPQVALQELQNLSDADRSALSGGVIALVNAQELTNPYFLNTAKIFWRYPSVLKVKGADGRILSGLEALDHMERELAGLDESDV